MEEKKEYYTLDEVKELGVPWSTWHHWIYIAKKGKAIEKTKIVKEYVVPAEVVEKWQILKRNK
jgi:hypothetical protein